MKTTNTTWVEQMLLNTKLGVMVLGMLTIMFMPQMIQTAHAQAHSNHLHAFSNAMAYSLRFILLGWRR